MSRAIFYLPQPVRFGYPPKVEITMVINPIIVATSPRMLPPPPGVKRGASASG